MYRDATLWNDRMQANRLVKYNTVMMSVPTTPM